VQALLAMVVVVFFQTLQEHLRNVRGEAVEVHMFSQPEPQVLVVVAQE
jgi:hypothetical protein